MKAELLLLSVIAILFCGAFSNVRAATISAASCSYSDVVAAINSASPGDTVKVPAGSCTWDNTLQITKGISLIGAGIGNTTITNNANGILGYNGDHCWSYIPSNYDLNTPFRISGFTINLGGKAAWLSLGEDAKKAPFTIQTNIRIDHNRIYNPKSASAAMIWTYGDMYGVIDNNQFEGAWYAFKSDPQIVDSYGWYTTSPQKDFALGSNKFMYWEDNIISLTTSDNILVESQYGGRYTFRYNTITGASSYSLFEMHGHQSDMPSCFGGEIYGNLIVGGSTLHKTRGGSTVVFYNNITGGVDNVAYSGLVVCPSDAPEMQMIHDTYWFINRVGYTGFLTSASATADLNGCGIYNNRPLLGRDVISDSSSPAHVGCGAALPGACTINDAYWMSSQSCTDLTDLVGDINTYPTRQAIAGTLYKCTSTNHWTAFYTPYTYPHPLRMESYQTCFQLGGSCCTSDQTCSDSFQYSQDCGSLCCVEGTCEAASLLNINFVSPTPNNATTLNRNYIAVNVSLSKNAGSCLLNWYNGSWTNVSMAVTGTSCYLNMTALANGTYQFGVYANDTASNMNVSQMRQNSVYSCIHESDIDCDGCVTIPELNVYINRWEVSNVDVTMRELIEVIGFWKSGC